MTTVKRSYPTRVDGRFKGEDGPIVPDQFRTVVTTRLVKRLGRVNAKTSAAGRDDLAEMFAP